MNWRQTPDAQIAQVLLRSLNPQDARWLYLVIAASLAIALIGGGFAGQWDAVALAQAIFGTIVFCLQFVGMYAFTALMRLNVPVASQLVPGYVPALRRCALGTWLGICLITGLAGILDRTSDVWGFFESAFIAGTVMLLISAPMRWPVQWCLSIAGLGWFGRSDFFFDLVTSRDGLPIFLTLMYLAMCWLVPRMISEQGSPYASLFSRFLGMQHTARVVEKSDASAIHKLDSWLKAYAFVAHGVMLPWRRYARYRLSSQRPGSTNLVARAELGFGPVVHWVTQVSFSVAFAVSLVLAWQLYPGSILEDGARTEPLTVFYIALISFMCAATPVLYIADAMLRMQGEQRLMLLLPGMPQGQALTRMLASRHVRQAFAAWAMTSAWALVLPYPDSVAIYVAAFCWGTLPLVPFIVQDWAALRPPSADRAILSLVLTLLMPICAWAALRWLHVPVELLAVIAVGACLLVLRIRWSRLAQFAQALPAGRFA